MEYLKNAILYHFNKYVQLGRLLLRKDKDLALNIAINFIRTGNLIHLVKIESHIYILARNKVNVVIKNAKSLYYKTQFKNSSGNDLHNMGFKKNLLAL